MFFVIENTYYNLVVITTREKVPDTNNGYFLCQKMSDGVQVADVRCRLPSKLALASRRTPSMPRPIYAGWCCLMGLRQHIYHEHRVYRRYR